MEKEQQQRAAARRRNRRRRRIRRTVRTLCLLLVVAGVVLAARWVVEPQRLQEEKEWLQTTLRSFGGKALLVVEPDSGEVLLAQREEKRFMPASLAKLFVIDYATTFTELDDVVDVSEAALALTKEESSVAWLEARPYYLRDLFAAMLIPSGNDAAYAVVDYCGGLIDPEAQPGQARVDVFMEHLNGYLRQQGYEDTMLYDPSGFDEKAYTTAEDLCAVTAGLLEQEWVREMVGQLWYAAELPDGSTQSWKNTNLFLEPASEFYNADVTGIKTGSMPGNYHLLVLYEQNGKEFLICSLGSISDNARYEAVGDVLKTIDEKF